MEGKERRGHPVSIRGQFGQWPLTDGESEAAEEELSSLPTLGPYRLPLQGGQRIKKIQKDEEVGLVIALGGIKAGSQGTTGDNHLLEGKKVRP